MSSPRSIALPFLIATAGFRTLTLGSCARYTTAPDVSQTGTKDAGFDQGAFMDADAARVCQLPDLLKGAGSMNSLGPWIANPASVLSDSSDAGLNGGPAALLCGPNELLAFFSLKKDLVLIPSAGTYRFLISHRNAGTAPAPSLQVSLFRSSGEVLVYEDTTPKPSFDCKQVTTTVVIDGGVEYLVPQIATTFSGASQCILLDEARMYSVPLGSQFPPECDCPTL
jgi:hypothetical protein